MVVNPPNLISNNAYHPKSLLIDGLGPPLNRHQASMDMDRAYATMESPESMSSSDGASSPEVPSPPRPPLDDEPGIPLRNQHDVASNVRPSTPLIPGVLPPRYPKHRDDWAVYKGLLYRLYVTEGEPLPTVRRIMEETYQFSASTAMYKKKFRQWKFQTGRKGWDKRESIKPSSTLVRNPEPPAKFLETETSLWHIWSNTRKTLSRVTPPGYKPMESTGDSREQLAIVIPDCVLVFLGSIMTGMQFWTTGKVSTCGAFFEKAFGQVKSIVEREWPQTCLWLLPAINMTLTNGQSKLLNILLRHIYKMALTVHGSDHYLVEWTKRLQHSPDVEKWETIQLYASAEADAIGNVLGRYSAFSLESRLKLMFFRTRRRNGYSDMLEWKQCIEDCRQASKRMPLLVRQVQLVYGQLLMCRGEHKKAEAILVQCYDRVKNANCASDDHHTLSTCLIASGNYCECLAAQGRDEEAERTYKAVIDKYSELIESGYTNASSMKMDVKGSYASFLAARGRIEETNKVYAEIDTAMKEFMLEQRTCG